jgi:hypothetical protein
VRLLYIAALSMTHAPFAPPIMPLVTVVLSRRYKQLPYAALDQRWPTRRSPTTDDE